ncbi:MAG TPA: signal recognition particle-docking protein FtsY [Candidatus Nanoarchaeia archaeon]|nr:signal recognition particle-docking protein FtsY [Candidatus Nanoarchaeia archaeon]
MFAKLKEKLKERLSIFSRKTVEEAEEKTAEIVAPKTVVANTPKASPRKPSAEDLLLESIKEDQKEIKKDTEKKVEKPVQEVKKKEERRKQEKREERKIVPSKEYPLPKKEERQEKEQKKKETTVLSKKEDEDSLQESAPNRDDEGLINEALEEKAALEEEKEPAKKEQQPHIEEQEEQKEPEKKSFFSKIKQAFTTKTISAEKFNELFWDLEVTLLENNVSVEVIEKIKEDLKKELVDKPLPRDVESKIEETLRQTLSEILDVASIDLLSKIKDKKPFVIAFFGINGAGKTTSIAKVTKYLQSKGKTVVLAACDTFRAAAIQQLEEHAQKLGVKIIKQDYGSDAAAVAFDAVRYAEKNKIDVVLIDTAGRLHSNTNLMAELKKLIKVAKPDLKIFVGESITGNDCIEQARTFNEVVEQDGVILTKADVDEKGGAPLSISYVIKKPILFLGVGQRYEDLEPFNKEKMLQRLGF